MQSISSSSYAFDYALGRDEFYPAQAIIQLAVARTGQSILLEANSTQLVLSAEPSEYSFDTVRTFFPFDDLEPRALILSLLRVATVGYEEASLGAQQYVRLGTSETTDIPDVGIRGQQDGIQILLSKLYKHFCYPCHTALPIM
jgi:hypothetical protein